jgi:putative transposase
MPSHRKTIRLSRPIYLGQKAHFITICCDRRSPYLEDPTTAQPIISVLMDCAARYSFLLHAYCAMPDHIHFLTQGTQPDSNLLELVRVFKLRTAYGFKKERRQRLWEMSFYDHILRKADEIESVACYIWNNPVRAGLCETPDRYRYSGSQTIDWIKNSRSKQTFIPEWKSR